MKVTLIVLVAVLGVAMPYLTQPVSACPGMSGAPGSESASSCCGNSCDCGMKNAGGQVELAMLPSTVSPAPNFTSVDLPQDVTAVVSDGGRTVDPEVPLDVSQKDKIYDRLSQQRI